MFSIKNDLKKKDDALSPLPSNCALDYAVRMVEVNHGGLKLNGAHQLMVHVHDQPLGVGIIFFLILAHPVYKM